jgi:hypothetical protein
VGHLIGFVNGILMMLNGLITEICQFKFPVKIAFQYCIRIAGCGVCNQGYRDRCLGYATPPAGSSSCDDGSCKKCECNNLSTGGGDGQAEFLVSIGWKCLFGGIICQNCNTLCPNQGGFMGTPPGNYKFRCCGWFNNDGTANANAFQSPCKKNESTPPSTGYEACDSTSGGEMNNPSFLFTQRNCSTKWNGSSGSACSDQSYYDSPCGAGTISFTPPSELPSPACCPWCCIKIPLIPLKCNEEGKSESVTIL